MESPFTTISLHKFSHKHLREPYTRHVMFVHIVVCTVVAHFCYSFQAWFDFSAISESDGSEKIIAQEREHHVLERLHAVSSQC